MSLNTYDFFHTLNFYRNSLIAEILRPNGLEVGRRLRRANDFSGGSEVLGSFVLLAKSLRLFLGLDNFKT
jgi:hypothetical protein